MTKRAKQIIKREFSVGIEMKFNLENHFTQNTLWEEKLCSSTAQCSFWCRDSVQWNPPEWQHPHHGGGGKPEMMAYQRFQIDCRRVVELRSGSTLDQPVHEHQGRGEGPGLYSGYSVLFGGFWTSALLTSNFGMIFISSVERSAGCVANNCIKIQNSQQIGVQSWRLPRRECHRNFMHTFWSFEAHSQYGKSGQVSEQSYERMHRNLGFMKISG